MRSRFVITYFFLLFIALTANGQSFKQEKRIYLVDVTASMSGKGIIKTPNIFDEVKKELVKAVESINDLNTEIVIIPFTNEPHAPIKGVIKDKETLLNNIRDLTIKRGDTNIADAWNYGLQEIDSTRINYIFMLTDGLHNCGPENEVLYDRLRDWADFAAKKYYFAFYVMLTPNAKEQEICDIIERTDQMWLIESMNVNTTFINSSLNIQANIKKHKTVKLHFTTNNPDIFKTGIDFKISIDDNPYYKIANFSSHLDERGYILFDIIELKPLIKIPLEVKLGLHIIYDKKKYPMIFFTPEELNFNIINKGIREMTIKEKIQ